MIRTATKKASRTEPAEAARKPVSRKPDSESAFRRVQVARAFEDIARQIREELSRGRLRPGDRLPAERELAVQFGVSRNTLREALRSLEIEASISNAVGRPAITSNGALLKAITRRLKPENLTAGIQKCI